MFIKKEPETMGEKLIHYFSQNKCEGNAEMKNLLGGKGANLAEMCNIGVPVPPGFTISTSACKVYYQDNRSSVIQVADYSDPEKIWIPVLRTGMTYVVKSKITWRCSKMTSVVNSEIQIILY